VKVLDKLLGRAPSQREFAALMMRSFSRVGMENSRYDEREFALRFPDSNTVAFLTNLYAGYCHAPRAARRAMAARFAASFARLEKIPDDFASASTHFMPVVRDPAYFSLARLHDQAAGKDERRLAVPGAELAEDLLVHLAWDTESSISAVNLERLEGWGVSLDEALKLAKDNLREHTEPGSMSEPSPGLFCGQWGDSYESSRMLLIDLVYRLEVSGDPVAFVPHRSQFWVTGTHNLAGLRALLKSGEETHSIEYPLSPNLYVLRDGNWKLYEPPAPELRELWLALRRRRLALDYQQQKTLLDAIHEQQRIDVFVAAYALFNLGATGKPQSTCVWTKGVDTLLPKVEQVTFLINPESREVITVPWQAALSVMGNVMEEQPELWPKRYRVRSFPDEAQILELRELRQAGPTEVS